MARRNTPETVLARLVADEAGCLIWPHSKSTAGGYGRVTLEGRLRFVHRIVYEHLVGPVPPGMVIDHRCNNPACANIAHLAAVTQRENILRSHGLAASQVARTHCPAGHPYEGHNLILDKRGSRHCRQCMRIRSDRYKARKRAGLPVAAKGSVGQTVADLVARVERSPEGCWLWPGTKPGSYGVASLSGRRVLVHRVIFESLRGPVAAGLVLDHKCRNHACANPDHLEPVTAGENVLRGESPIAHIARRTHCRNGHLLSGENLRLNPDGSRACRTCRREKSRRWRETHPGYHKRFR